MTVVDENDTGVAARRDDVLLRVEGVQKYFPITGGGILKRKIGDVKAVESISFDVVPGETLGVVGESGCGKSTAGRTVMKLLDPTSGSIKFEGQEIADIKPKELVAFRREAQMIFQDPYSSLNPRKRIGQIIGAPLKLHGIDKAQIAKRSAELLDRVGLQREHLSRFPHEFSGGQRQRIGIARALALEPKLIVLDEPVSALDVSIQAQIVNLLDDLQDDFGLTYLFVAHDLSVVRHVSDRIAVMYLGRIMELSPSEELYVKPIHPYTRALLAAIPIPDPRENRARERGVITGEPPSPVDPPPGCVFHTRCPRAQDVCRTEIPQLSEYAGGHLAACHFPLNVTPAEVAAATRSQDSPRAASPAAPQVLSESAPAAAPQ